MSKWINVNQRRPEEGVLVLLQHVDGTMYTGCKHVERPTFEESFHPFDFFASVDEYQCFEWTDITHWMDLPPEVPKEERENAHVIEPIEHTLPIRIDLWTNTK